jgi:hypothetical protein
MAAEGTDMTELTFLAGLVLGVAIGVPMLARAWRVNVRGALKRGVVCFHPHLTSAWTVCPVRSDE